MTSKKEEYERLLNEHRIITNQISDIKADSFDLNDEQKQKIRFLELKLIGIMEQMKRLF
jgi:hypothetical protein